MNGPIDEESVIEMFKVFDEKNIFIETVVLNAADQGSNYGNIQKSVKGFYECYKYKYDMELLSLRVCGKTYENKRRW